MTADPDAVTLHAPRSTPGARPQRRDRLARAHARPPPSCCPRPTRSARWRGRSSSERLLDGTERRLTIVVGGAGFGKSTLAARVAAVRPTAWYTLDASDRHIGALAAGIAASLRLQLPAIPADLADAVDELDRADRRRRDHGPGVGRRGARHRRPAVALAGDLVLVLDDLHVLAGATGSLRFVEALVRLAPADLHIVVTSRAEVPFAIERLRGQGQVVDLGGTTLAFSADEIRALLDALLGRRRGRRRPSHASPPPASTPRRVAGRRPSGSRSRPTGSRRAATARRRSTGCSARRARSSRTSPRRSSPEHPRTTRALIRHAVHFDRFSAPLLDAVGVPDPAATLDELSKRALFLQPLPGRTGLVRAPRPDPGVHAVPPPAERVRDPRPPSSGRRVVRGRGPARGGAELVRRGARPRRAGPLHVRPRRDARPPRRDAPGRRGDGRGPRGAPHAPHRTGPRRGLPGPRRVAAGARGVRPGGRPERPARRGNGLAHGRRPRRSRGVRRGARDLRAGRGRRDAAGRRGAAEGLDRVGARPSRRRRGERPGGRGGRRARRRPATTRGRWPRRTRRWA